MKDIREKRQNVLFAVQLNKSCGVYTSILDIILQKKKEQKIYEHEKTRQYW